MEGSDPPPSSSTDEGISNTKTLERDSRDSRADAEWARIFAEIDRAEMPTDFLVSREPDPPQIRADLNA